jgi:hypothetical protein
MFANNQAIFNYYKTGKLEKYFWKKRILPCSGPNLDQLSSSLIPGKANLGPAGLQGVIPYLRP